MMKKKMMSILAITVLMLAFTPTSPAFERHPHIRSAIRALEEARGELQTAAHDFGGHRVEALRAVDEAIKQLQICLQYDRD